MNVPQRHNPTDVDTAVAAPPAEPERTSSDAAAADAPAAEGMDRDDWLCRVGDVARLLREQRRAAQREEGQPAEDQARAAPPTAAAG
jgi:hypothetical protein